MNFITKKLNIALLALMAFVALPVFSYAASFNDHQYDCRTTMVAIAGEGVTESDPCWKDQTSVTTQDGDRVNVRVYYHNTSNHTATDTRIFLTDIENSTRTSFSITGRVSASNANSASSNVTVYVQNGGTLTLEDVKWYPNQSQHNSTSAYSNDSTIFSSGLQIGDIGPDDPYNQNNTWVTQGSVVATFRVDSSSNNNDPACDDGIDNDNDGYTPSFNLI